jgi:hypothetical protein
MNISFHATPHSDMTVIEERGCLCPIQNNSDLAQGPFRLSGGWFLTSAPGRWVRRTIGRLIMKTQYTVLEVNHQVRSGSPLLVL